MNAPRPLAVRCRTERWPLAEPFGIAREVMHEVPLLHVEIEDAHGRIGRAEAAGVDYEGETPATMAAQVEAVAHRLHDGVAPEALQAWLPPGGARNALDTALLDLQARRAGVPLWRWLGLPPPAACVTAFTIGLADDATLDRRARAAHADGLPLLKLKLDAARHVDVVERVRAAAPGARLVVDANEAWTPDLLDALLPRLQRLGVELIEQPLPRGADAALAGFASPIPICADESCTDRACLERLPSGYGAINVKLDKTGGLTEALALVHAARARGLAVMLGNMCGTSLGMAPALLLAPLAQWVDLDGPLLLARDRQPALRIERGVIHPPETA
jgi:L-alanine-DL-glutamate epimerase-like enolase superfamily enzyme